MDIIDRLTPHYQDNSILARLRLAAMACIAAFAPRCTSRPKIARGGASGAYGHWRCERRRGHKGAHRHVNYVWNRSGETAYAPVPADLSSVSRLA